MRITTEYASSAGRVAVMSLTGIKNSLPLQACAPDVRIGSVMSCALKIAQLSVISLCEVLCDEVNGRLLTT